MTTVYTTHPRYLDHDLSSHPEYAGRIEAVWQHLNDTGLAARMQSITPAPADTEHLLRVHTRSYLNELADIAKSIKQLVLINPDTYFGPDSYEIARLAAGGVIQAVEAVSRGDAGNALAVVRPPGHHATPDRAMGFCLLSNIAIAAAYARQTQAIERVLIVDYDVHHGNGTQDMFYADDGVLFISTHQYPFYPGTGALDETGTGRGAGTTINIPLPAGHGDPTFTAIYEQVIWPAARRFQPDIILVSAGFDAHFVDPLGGLRLSLAGYNHITRELVRMAENLCDGKIVFVMEGGYDLTALAHGIGNIAKALLGDTNYSDPLGDSPAPQRSPDQNLIDNIRRIHQL